MSKIKSFKIYTDDADKVLIANSLETALEVLENNGYIVELENEENKVISLESQLIGAKHTLEDTEAKLSETKRSLKMLELEVSKLQVSVVFL